MAEENTVDPDLDPLEIVIDLDEGDAEGGDGLDHTDEAHKTDVEVSDGELDDSDEDPIIIDIVDAEDSNEASRLQTEIEELRESYLRKLAEFDNYRKRTDREKTNLRRTAGEVVVREIVPVLDNFERALSHAVDTDPDAFRLGVEMIAKQLWEVLERQGLEKLDPEGQAFEPEFHEAIQRVEDSQHPPGTVVWVLAKGYTFGGKLLRPAMVGVAVERSPEVVNEAQDETNSVNEGDSQ